MRSIRKWYATFAESHQNRKQTPQKESLERYIERHNPLNWDYPIYLEYQYQIENRYTAGNPHAGLNQLIGRNTSVYEDWTEKVVSLRDDFTSILTVAPDSSPSNQPYVEPIWNNDWLPPFDGMTLHTFLTILNPENYFEIGSGTSTKFARRAIRLHNLRTRIISIDPQPRSEVEQICDESIRVPLEKSSLSNFEQLKSGDILFVDSSHRIFTNSDVTVVFLEILPILKPGVIVHFHDILLPYDYPEDWKHRYYSEQYGLAILLMADQFRRYEILMPNFFAYADAGLQAKFGDFWNHPQLSQLPRHGASFWMRVRDDK